MLEQDAIRRCQAEDVEALGVLYQLHHVAVLRTAFGILGQRDMAQDVTHQVFLELLTAIRRFDTRRKFTPWLIRIAVNLSLKELRRRKIRREIPLEEAELPLLEANAPEQAAEDAELQDVVWDAIRALEPRHRATIVLRYYLGFSQEEIATAMHCRQGTVKSRLHRALRHLKEVIASQVEGLVPPVRISTPEQGSDAPGGCAEGEDTS